MEPTSKIPKENPKEVKNQKEVKKTSFLSLLTSFMGLLRSTKAKEIKV